MPMHTRFEIVAKFHLDVDPNDPAGITAAASRMAEEKDLLSKGFTIDSWDAKLVNRRLTAGVAA